MHKLILASLALLLFSSQALAVDLKTDKQKTSYIVGFQIGQQLTKDGIDLDQAAFLQALEDVKSGAEPKLSQEEVQVTMQRVREAREMEMAKKGEAALQEGAAFLAANKKKDGVQVTASGLQYKVLTAGSGKTPTATDTVKVHYRGTLINGTEFDSSYQRGNPIEFPVNGVIKGWTEALQLMKEGAKWQLFIPSDLAYGARGAGATITPHATLIFDVELLAVKGK
ncbi:MAG: FKBP-type peptidyl-prolyl cis-trans isomerase [Proteobacteria bacterium]|nr:FKBP-type peptidyl-prolyl cis-trans isomerase [Pseudomonadota bacterium]MBU1641373.1 FKBP-type peptidyl-prolyl cis-trans isomerase [Pseudomonadota bacterium]